MSRPESIRPKQWAVAAPVPAHVRDKMRHLHPILLQVLYNRGITDSAHIQSFLDGHYLESEDPFLLPDMAAAVARIRHAIDHDETIFVYGDFDADGVTSTVLLTEALRGLGVERRRVQPYIPDRVDEGYGLNNEALETIKAKGGNLVISVDCGIRSVAEVEHAKALGLDMIITDHHSLGPRMPAAHAVINPKRSESRYPETMLAGVGIAYKLAQALHAELPTYSQMDVTRLLDLVAIGTVADLAPLLAENRKLVIDGLAVLNDAKRPGVAALAEAARTKPGQISAESIGFFIGPRINAAGRLAHAYSAAKLLAAHSLDDARRYAHELEQLNRKRQQLTEELSQHAETLIDPSAPLLMVADETFQPGVVGLVASRLADRHYRPAIVLERGPDESRASCRSIPEFHITDALDEVAHLLERHGGHAQAAGFTVRNENLPALTEALIAIAHRELDGQELTPTLTIDAEVPLHQIDWALHDTLAQLEPTGYANPTPVLMSRNVQVINSRVVGRDSAHLQIEVAAEGMGLKGIAFRQGAWFDTLPRMIDIAYTVNVNEWRGRRTLQLNVQDIRAAQPELV